MTDKNRDDIMKVAGKLWEAIFLMVHQSIERGEPVEGARGNILRNMPTWTDLAKPRKEIFLHFCFGEVPPGDFPPGLALIDAACFAMEAVVITGSDVSNLFNPN